MRKMIQRICWNVYHILSILTILLICSGDAQADTASGCTALNVLGGILNLGSEIGLIYDTVNNHSSNRKTIMDFSVATLVLSPALDIGSIVCLAIGVSEGAEHTWISSIVALGISIIPIAHAGYIVGNQDAFFNDAIRQSTHPLSVFSGKSFHIGPGAFGPRTYGLTFIKKF